MGERKGLMIRRQRFDWGTEGIRQRFDGADLRDSQPCPSTVLLQSDDCREPRLAF